MSKLRASFGAIFSYFYAVACVLGDFGYKGVVVSSV